MFLTTPPEDSQVVKDLKATKQLLIDNGWCKKLLCIRNHSSNTDHYCIMGALNQVTSDHFGYDEDNIRAQEATKTIASLIDSTKYCHPRQLSDPVDWYNHVTIAVHYNNHPDTTKEDILNLLDKAITKALVSCS